MLSANFIPNHFLFKHLRPTGLKSGSEFDVSSAVEQSSCGFYAGAWCALSGLHLPRILIIHFILSLGHVCSSRFSFVPKVTL